jgi:acetyl/propionyl-CoA carboxylase alpha subunit
MDSAGLAQKLAAYDAAPVTSASALNEALGKYGVPEIRTNVAGLRTTVANTTNALNNVDPSVTGRTSGSLVTEAQRSRLVNNERAPIASELQSESGNLNTQEQSLRDAMGMATGEADRKVADYTTGRNALQSQYDTTYKRESDAADRAAQAAAAAEQQRQFNVGNNTKLSTSGSGSTKALSQQEVTAGIRQGLEAVKGGDNHVAPKDLKKAYDLWLSSGLSDKSFWSNFQGYWNPKQANYKQQFYG